MQLTYSTYFKFQDNNKWALDSKSSTTHFVYFQYKGFDVQHELEV